MEKTAGVERVLKFIELFYSGDLDGALSCCRDDIVLTANGPVAVFPDFGVCTGKIEVRKRWEGICSRYDSMRCKLSMIVSDNNSVAAIVRIYLRKRDSGRTISFDNAVFYTLRDGQIAGIRELLDTFDLVEQVTECDLTELLAVARTKKTFASESAS